MKRKVIKQGNNTLTITLPKKWTQQYGIKAGDEIEIEDKGQTLGVSTKKENVLKKISININHLDKPVVDALLPVLHKSGYDEIELIFDEPVHIKTIQKRINSMLIGYEIIEQTNKKCLVKSIASEQDTNIENLVRRTFLVTLALARNSLEAVKSGNFKDIDELLVLEETNNKLTNFCERILNKNHEGPKTTYLYIVIWLLEKIADNYRDICKILADKNIKINKEITAVCERTVALLEHYYHIFYKFDLKEMKILRQEHRELVDDLCMLRGDNKMLYCMFDLTQRIYDCFAATTGMQY